MKQPELSPPSHARRPLVSRSWSDARIPWSASWPALNEQYGADMKVGPGRADTALAWWNAPSLASTTPSYTGISE